MCGSRETILDLTWIVLLQSGGVVARSGTAAAVWDVGNVGCATGALGSVSGAVTLGCLRVPDSALALDP